MLTLVLGSTSVKIRSTGHDKDRITAMLCVSAAGQWCQTLILNKLKTSLKKADQHGFRVRYQDSVCPATFLRDVLSLFRISVSLIVRQAFMDENCMIDWIRHCFAPSLPPLSSAKRTLLVLDSHRAHITAACYQLFNELNVDVVVIPGCSSFVTDLKDLQCIRNSFSLCFLGLTSVLQPLDRCINGPIEKLLVASWSVWFEEQESSLDYVARTKGGNLRAPSQGTVLGWLAAAIASLSSNRGDLLSQAFKYCGITNNLDGTEYDMIYEEPETEENDGSKNSKSLDDADQADHDDMEVDVADESSTECSSVIII